MRKDMGVPASPSGCQPTASAADASSRSGIPNASLSCNDCNRPYSSPAWVEAVVPHHIWNRLLSPTGNEGGILCINCMADRLAAKGLSDIPIRITAGPFVTKAKKAWNAPGEEDVLAVLSDRWERMGDIAFRLGFSPPKRLTGVLQSLRKRGLIECKMLCGHYVWRESAQGIEAGTATTAGRGPKDESPVANGDAP